MIDLNEFEFIDFGCGNGGSSILASSRFGGKGFGIDIDQTKLKEGIAKGQTCVYGDILNFEFPEKCVRYAVSYHVLEHLPNISAVTKALQKMVTTAKEFVHILIPYFDADEYLATLGYTMCWSTWHGHPMRINSEYFKAVLPYMGVKNFTISGVTNGVFKPEIVDTTHRVIYPISAGKDCLCDGYKEEKYGKKEFIIFDRPVHAETEVKIYL